MSAIASASKRKAGLARAAVSKVCGNHPQRSAAARCSACNARMCGECFRHAIDDRPACAKCAFVESTRIQRRVSLAVAFVLIAGGIVVVLLRQEKIDLVAAVISMIAAATVTVVVWVATRPATAAVVRTLDEEEQLDAIEPMAGAAHPYRARARRAALAAAPKVSGVTTVLVVLASLAFCGIAAPSLLRLELWVELEIAIAGAWLSLTAVLAVLLHQNYRLRDDFVFVPPWKRFEGSGSSLDLPGCDGCAVDGEAIAVILLLLVALVAAFLLVELVVPLVFVLAYAVILKALKTAAHDRHDCGGHLGRSVGWGAAWSFLYMLPLATLVWVVHLLR